MPIYVPGRRDRHNRPLRGSNRSVVAMLSMTAMVDMFTVLTVFLLQNYNSTGEVMEMDDKVELPKASQTNELAPAHVVMVSKEGIFIDQALIVPMALASSSVEMVLPKLAEGVKSMIKKAEGKNDNVMGTLKKAVAQTKPPEARPTPANHRKITVQADKGIPYGIIRKVMFTVTDAGASEINFAVIKEEKTKQSN